MSENIHHLSGNLLVGSSHLFVDTTNNRVGITTADPDAGLHVNSNAYVHTDFRVGSGIAMNVTSGRITAGSFDGDGSLLSGVNSDSGSWVNGTNSNVHLATLTDKVGIGTHSPGAELHVAGTGAIVVPSGTTEQRPGTEVNGMLRYNSQTGYMEAYTVSGWGFIATPPTIQTISPASIAVSAVTTQVFTVTGAFFDAQTTLQLQGGDNTLYNVTDFTFTNSDSIGFKMGTLATGQAANRPYKVVVTNGAGLSATSTATIGFVGSPSWTSPAAGATLANFLTSGSANNTELAATDDLGGSAVTFSVPESNLPSGLTLNGSTGAITGQIGATGTTSVTFRITDNVSGSTLDRTFSIVGSTSLYAFSSPMEFTNAGATGYAGPTLSQLRSAYSPTWTDNSNYLNVTTQGYQLWTVPETGSYTIEAIGAKGGDQDGNGSGGVGGYGARMKGTFSLTINEVITILVGQQGTWAARGSGGRSGGGGGTFVANSANAPLIVAAGGGGWGGSGGNGKHGQAAATGLTGAQGGAAAVSGSSGQANSNTGNGGWGSGGAAFYSNPGHDPDMYNGHTTTYYRASAFVNSGTGAYGDPGPSPNGGFGGGGGGAGNGGGGGGGWSGGGGSGGSGGSVNNGVALIASSGYNSTGHGSVIITKI